MGENYDELLAELAAIEGVEYEELMSVGERAAAAIRALREQAAEQRAQIVDDNNTIIALRAAQPATLYCPNCYCSCCMHETRANARGASEPAKVPDSYECPHCGERGTHEQDDCHMLSAQPAQEGK